MLRTEYHVPNSFYGLDWILREYAGLPPDEHLPWAMEHYISFNAPKPATADVTSRLPLRLAVSEGQAEILRQWVTARVLPIGSAFFYMQRLYHRWYPGRAEVGERRGTIVFPTKSHVRKDRDFDRASFARRLAALPTEYQPVVVSVYWKDFLRGTYRAFEEAGLQVVTSGHYLDQWFLFRQYDLCRQFKYACANEISTSFCLSVLSGCRFFYLPTGALRVSRDGVVTTYDEEPTLSRPGKQACLAASPFPPTGDGSRQRELAEQFAGKASVRPPEFFRELFAEGRRLLQASLPPSVEFRHRQEFSRLAGWLPYGIDADGWAAAKCGLTVPALPANQAGGASVLLHFHVPRRACQNGQAEWTLALDDGEPTRLRVQPGFWRLEIPAGRAGWPRRVIITGDAEFRLSEHDPRRRAFRLFQLTWHERPAPSAQQPVCRRQPFPAWARELRGRGAWVREMAREVIGRTWMGDAFRHLKARRGLK